VKLINNLYSPQKSWRPLSQLTLPIQKTRPKFIATLKILRLPSWTTSSACLLRKFRGHCAVRAREWRTYKAALIWRMGSQEGLSTDHPCCLRM